MFNILLACISKNEGSDPRYLIFCSYVQVNRKGRPTGSKMLLVLDAAKTHMGKVQYAVTKEIKHFHFGTAVEPMDLKSWLLVRGIF